MEKIRFQIVSSPQGNATNKWENQKYIIAYEPFQVPKGMLQTFLKGVEGLDKISFKSPRECYKHYVPCSSAYVPSVSSPQGNATN